MSDAIDNHIQDFFRAFCSPDIDFIPVHEILCFCERRGIDMIVFVDSFIEKHPSWDRHRFGKGIQLNKGGPAQREIARYASGNIRWEAWSRDGKEHRENGPADIRYDECGNVIFEAWWRDGKIYTPTTHERLNWLAGGSK